MLMSTMHEAGLWEVVSREGAATIPASPPPPAVPTPVPLAFAAPFVCDSHLRALSQG